MTAPLAARMRPRSFDEFFGQPHLVAPTAAFRRAVDADRLGSVIFWGPPGVGKTTLAEIVADRTQAHFERLSAVSSGVADLRRVVEEAKRRAKPSATADLFADAEGGVRLTILFIDEIHRFNKSQQDAVLPYVEDGTLRLIGATTENPSFEVNAALLSRSRVYVLHPLTDEQIVDVLRRAIGSPKGFGERFILPPEPEEAIANLANGDARSALNMLELCANLAEAECRREISLEDVRSAYPQRALLYDKGGEQHYDLISALHKTVRNTDPDAAVYWLARMLEAGEDPIYIARRLVRMASEDIGLADPQALPIAMAAQQATHLLGMPECALALAQATIYLAQAPKSNAIYVAYKGASADVQRSRNEPVPLHLRNAPTGLMKSLGYGEGYRYAHDAENGIAEQTGLPAMLLGNCYYRPTDRGFELEVSDRLAQAARLTKRRQPDADVAAGPEQYTDPFHGPERPTDPRRSTRDEETGEQR